MSGTQRLPSRGRKALRTAIRWGLSAGILVVVALVLRDRVGAVGGLEISPPAPWAVAVALMTFAIANETLVRAWLALVAMGGGRLDVAVGRWAWASSQLTRYAIGMAQVASRAVVARRHGLRASAGAVTTLLEVIWYSCLNGLVAAATVPFWLPGSGLEWAAVLPVIPGLVLILATVAPAPFLTLAARLATLPPLDRLGVGDVHVLRVTRRDTLALTGTYVANFVLRLTGFVALFVGVGGTLDDAATVGRVVGAFALGHLIGALAVFAPGGLGPREGVTAAVLAPLLGAGPVLLLVAVTRLLELVAELAFTGLARLAAPSATWVDGEVVTAGGYRDEREPDSNEPRDA